MTVMCRKRKYNGSYFYFNKVNICLHCEKELKNRYSKYCSNQCQRDYQYKVDLKPKFNQGLVVSRGTLRRILTTEKGGVCSVCNLSDWNNKKLVLEVDHIDGNAYNNMPDNLRLVCPNCHSQTEFYKGANRGNGRKARLVKSV